MYLGLFGRFFGIKHVLDFVFPIRVLRTSLFRADNLELVQFTFELGLPFLISV